MKKFIVLIAGVSALALSGCVSQEQADAKMIVGCKAAVGAMIAPTEIKDVKSSDATNEKTMGSVYRRITLKYTQVGDFAETEKEGSCLFSQQWGLFKSSHASLLEQVVYNGELLGKKDGNVVGDLNQFLKLNETVDAAMAQQ